MVLFVFHLLNNLIKSFLRSKSITKSYRVEKKTKNLVKVFLRHSDVTFELMKFLNTEQITNPKLKGIKCSMQILQERQSSFPINKNLKSKSSDEENEEEIEESVTKKEIELLQKTIEEKENETLKKEEQFKLKENKLKKEIEDNKKKIEIKEKEIKEKDEEYKNNLIKKNGMEKEKNMIMNVT